MIHTTLNRDGQIATRDFEDVEAFAKFLGAEVGAGGDLLVRIPDDETFCRVEMAIVQSQIDAQRMTQMLAGTSKPFWSMRDPVTGALWAMPTGNGWVVRGVGLTTHSQAQQVPGPRNGLRLA